MKPICHICNKEMFDIVYLAKHLRKHKISTKDYYDRYFKKDGEGICYCGKETKFFTLEKGYLKYCGYMCSSNAVEVKEKHVSTCIERYGVNNVNLVDHVREKYNQTMIRNHGVTSPLKSTCIQNKRIETLIENYGVSIPLRSKQIQNKKKQTCLEKYGVIHCSQNSEIKRKIRITTIKRIEQQLKNNEPLAPFVGFQERPFLNELQKYSRYTIIRQDPSFRYVVGRFPDGHIPEVKLFIQFDEYHHFSDKECIQYREEDIQCTKDLESISGYRVFRVSQKDWDNNKQKIILKFLSYLPEDAII